MEQAYLNSKDLIALVAKLMANNAMLYAPIKEFDQPHLNQITNKNMDKIDLSGYRTIESLKALFFKMSQEVAQVFGEKSMPPVPAYIILGARACDLAAINIMDQVLSQGEFDDLFYTQNRKNTLIISADCTDHSPTCFCTMVNGQPFAKTGFDLNLTPISSGYVVEIGTEKGQLVIDQNKEILQKASQDMLAEKTALRECMQKNLEQNNKEFKTKLPLEQLHRINLENKHWKTLTQDCVECSNCNYTCPTCTCFLLLDQPGTRHKVWDACLKNSYARVAGGANSRPKLYERLQNRYHCKFDYSFERLGHYSCVGCGRCCIDGCAAKIDMRKVFVELEKQVPLTAKLI
jgi:ferredoxin